MGTENTNIAYRRLQSLAAYLFADMDDIIEWEDGDDIFTYRDSTFRVIDLPQEEQREYEFAVIPIV